MAHWMDGPRSPRSGPRSPHCQVHMLLARTPNAPAGAAGISLFLVPYLLPDGTRNDVELVRLKEMMIAAPLMR